MRQKTCKICKTKYIPDRPMQVCCSIPCAIEYGRNKKSYMERKDIQIRKRELLTISELANLAQSAVNKYVRLRDANLPCVSCGRPASWNGQWHASHYRSRGGCSHLRFNLLNLHRACSICNNHLSGNIEGYRRGLIERIGHDKLEMLEVAPKSRKFSREYLERIRSIFSKRARALEKKKPQ